MDAYIDASREDMLSEDQKEDVHRAQVVSTFHAYKHTALRVNQKRRNAYYSLSDRQRAIVGDYVPLLDEISRCIMVNAEFLEAVLDLGSFAPTVAVLNAPPVGASDHSKLKSTLKQCVRDWSAEGSAERDAIYGPILAALDRCYPGENRQDISVLVPGAGLGRLAWEIANAGFQCQANEFSLFMLKVSELILNHTSEAGARVLYPYVHSFSNVARNEDIVRPIPIPDVSPEDLSPSSGPLSFAAGDFLEIYTTPESWDCIVTCFFLDTSRNVLDYIEKITYLLKPKGTWINLGPTLWHFDNETSADDQSSFEVSLEQLKDIIRKYNYTLTDECLVPTQYTSNVRSLLKYEYQSSFFVATKNQ